MLKKSLTEFGCQHLFYRSIQILHIVFSGLKFGDQIVIICLTHREFYIHACLHRSITCLIHSLIQSLEFMLITDCAIISQNLTVKSHFLAQDIRQHLFIGRRCITARGAITRHNASQIIFLDCYLKWFTELFNHFPITHRHICAMNTSG